MMNHGFNNHHGRNFNNTLARIILLVDLREIFSDLGAGGRKKSSENYQWKKSSENDQSIGHFQSVFF